MTPLAISKSILLTVTALSLHDKEIGSGQVEVEGRLLGDRTDPPLCNLYPLPFVLRGF